MSNHQDEIGRVIRTKEQARRSYDGLSTWYDLLAGRSERRFKEAGLRHLAVAEGEKVLEIGFGTGQCTVTLAQSVGDMGQVHGIDISEGMFNITMNRVKKAGLSNRVTLKRGDATKLPFESSSFDAVFTSFTLELFDTPEIPTVLHECIRVLKSGGRMCVVAIAQAVKPSFMMQVYEWAHLKFPNYIDCRPILVEKPLQAAGFQIKGTRTMSMWTLPVEIVLAVKPLGLMRSAMP